MTWYAAPIRRPCGALGATSSVTGGVGRGLGGLPGRKVELQHAVGAALVGVHAVADLLAVVGVVVLVRPQVDEAHGGDPGIVDDGPVRPTSPGATGSGPDDVLGSWATRDGDCAAPCAGDVSATLSSTASAPAPSQGPLGS